MDSNESTLEKQKPISPDTESEMGLQNLPNVEPSESKVKDRGFSNFLRSPHRILKRILPGFLDRGKTKSSDRPKNMEGEYSADGVEYREEAVQLPSKELGNENNCLLSLPVESTSTFAKLPLDQTCNDVSSVNEEDPNECQFPSANEYPNLVSKFSMDDEINLSPVAKRPKLASGEHPKSFCLNTLSIHKAGEEIEEMIQIDPFDVESDNIRSNLEHTEVAAPAYQEGLKEHEGDMEVAEIVKKKPTVVVLSSSEDISTKTKISDELLCKSIVEIDAKTVPANDAEVTVFQQAASLNSDSEIEIIFEQAKPTEKPIDTILVRRKNNFIMFLETKKQLLSILRRYKRIEALTVEQLNRFFKICWPMLRDIARKTVSVDRMLLLIQLRSLQPFTATQLLRVHVFLNLVHEETLGTGNEFPGFRHHILMPELLIRMYTLTNRVPVWQAEEELVMIPGLLHLSAELEHHDAMYSSEDEQNVIDISDDEDNNANKNLGIETEKESGTKTKSDKERLPEESSSLEVESKSFSLPSEVVPSSSSGSEFESRNLELLRAVTETKQQRSKIKKQKKQEPISVPKGGSEISDKAN